MKFRLSLVAVLAVLAGACSQQDTASHAAATAASSVSAAQPGRAGAGFATVAGYANRFGSAPDHGALVAYPQQPVVRQDGAYTSYLAAVSEAHARNAIGGVLSIPLPNGEQLRFRYERHVEHPSGDWTWIGDAIGAKGEQAIITFGSKAAFGTLGQAGAPPWRLTVQNGVSWLVRTDPTKLASIDNAATRPTSPDYLVPPAEVASASHRTAASGVTTAASASTAAAAGTASNTVDLVIGYTAGFVSYYGGDSQAQTRLNNMVDITNEAYVNSGVDARVRLVKTLQVSYADNTSNDSALEALTGFKAPSTRTTPDAAFSALRAARDQYGADLVSLVRRFQDPENGGCGIAWLIGGGQHAIDSSDEFFGYSVVSDGRDAGTDGKTYYCREETLAHELGHNMGAQHDRGTAQGSDGVLSASEYGRYPYSFGYKTTSTTGNFYTIMAYGDSGQTTYRIFSNPRSTFCGGLPCGVDNEADNARTLVQTIPIVTSFRATVVADAPTPPSSGRRIPYDVNGDGRSDIVLRGDTALAYWAMNGTTRTFDSYLGTGGTGWRVVGFGDFDGTAGVDVLWANGSQMKIWFNMGGGNYVVYQMGTYGNGFEPFAVADVNGDGKSDILLRSGTAIAYWLLDGARVTGTAYAGDGGVGFRVVAVGDFTGDGADEIVWANTSQIKMWINGGNAGYSPVIVGNYGNGYVPFGAGYVDGDSNLDLLFRGGTAVAFWKLSGATLVSSAYLGDGGAGYVPFAIADYNGDGASDIGWQNGSTIKFWMNNGGSYTPGIVGNYNCCYVPIGNP